MFNRVLFGFLALLLFSVCNASAQVICPLSGTSSSKLVCLLPQVYGPWALNGVPAPNQNQSALYTNGHQGHFENGLLTSLGPINDAVGIQVSQLPLASPSSGISFIYDTSLKTFTPSTDESLGPILGERASTIGRNKLFVGFSYQYFNFSSVDGQSLNDIPAVFQHMSVPVPNGDGLPACSNQTALPTVEPCVVRDFIQTVNSISLRVNQFTVYATYGITRHMDLSVAIPILNVRMGVVSNATIVQNSIAPTSGFPGTPYPSNAWHQFNPSLPQCLAQGKGTLAEGACLNATFPSSGSSTGIGDVTFRYKYKVYDGERAGFAFGADIRVPTGDAQNFLGSGSTGVKPFGVFSYRSRVSPHAEVGYEVNGGSILAGDFIGSGATGAKGSMPNRFIYVVGADAYLVKRVTAAFDIYGQRLFSAQELVSRPFTDLGNCAGPTDSTGAQCGTYAAGTTHPNFIGTTGDYNITDASLGLKFRPYRNLVMTANVLLKLDSGGLRSKAVPLIGASYNF
jgi:hypothetical protein